MQAPLIFISHASEDKELLAEPLAKHLSEMGCYPWLDKDQLVPGESLTNRVGNALGSCNFAVLLITHSFLKKSWPRQEFRVLLARELNENRSIIIPVLHGVSGTALIDEFQLLLDRLWISSKGNVYEIATQIIVALRASTAIRITEDSKSKPRTTIRRLLDQSSYDKDLNFLLSNTESSIDKERLQSAVDREDKILVLLSASPAGYSTDDIDLGRKIHLGHLWMMRYVERLSHLVPKSKVVLSALPEYNYLTAFDSDEKRRKFIRRHLESWQLSLHGIASVNEISSEIVDQFCASLSPTKADQLTFAQTLFDALSLHIELSDQGQSELLRWRLGKVDASNSVTLSKIVLKVRRIARRLDSASDVDVALSLAYIAVFKWKDYGLSWLKLVTYLASDLMSKETLILESSKNAYVWRAAGYITKRFKLGRFPKLIFLKPVTDRNGLPIKGSLSTEYSLVQLEGYLARDDREARKHHDEIITKFAFESISELKEFITSIQRMVMLPQLSS